MDKAMDNKPAVKKHELDTGQGVNIIPLTTCQFVNHQGFDTRHKTINGYGQDRTKQKDYNGNPIQ